MRSARSLSFLRPWNRQSAYFRTLIIPAKTILVPGMYLDDDYEDHEPSALTSLDLSDICNMWIVKIACNLSHTHSKSVSRFHVTPWRCHHHHHKFRIQRSRLIFVCLRVVETCDLQHHHFQSVEARPELSAWYHDSLGQFCDSKRRWVWAQFWWRWIKFRDTARIAA